jgi:type II secretory pathway pseudopilin PulG
MSLSPDLRVHVARATYQFNCTLRCFAHARRGALARGFTLVEFTIVLVIAFLIIGGALKLTSMIDVAKANDVVAIAGDLSEATRLFKEKYKALPGDLPNAVAMITGATFNGDGNGLIDVNAINVAPNNMEPNQAADHLFRAGLIRRAPAGPIVSRYGNVWVMAYALAITPGVGGTPCGTVVDATAPLPVAQNVVVFDRLPVDVARDIDVKFDDGVATSGAIRASTPYIGVGSVPIVACFAMPL